jgi:hypothetical protein
MATEGAVLDHDTVLSVALLGCTLALSVPTPPTASVSAFGSSVTPVTLTTAPLLSSPLVPPQPTNAEVKVAAATAKEKRSFFVIIYPPLLQMTL